MQVEGITADRSEPRRGLAASLALHAVVVAALAATNAVRLLAPDATPVERIEVEFVEAPRPLPRAPTVPVEVPAPPVVPPAAASAAPNVPIPEAAPRPNVPAARPTVPETVPERAAPVDDGMVRPKRLLSAGVLSAGGSRAAREALRAMAGDERAIQLCDYEALEQIHAWNAAYQPETLIAHALAEAEVSGRTVEAKGGAFLSGRHWYGVAFRCEVSPDLGRVTAFAFKVGSEIPKRDWRRYDLPDPAGALD